MVGIGSEPYAAENPRFRKAYIRTRIEAIKAERTALLEERDAIDRLLASTRGSPLETEAETVEQWGNQPKKG